MRILGIDPGYGIVGYGIIDTDDGLRAVDYGVINTPKEEAMPARLAIIFESLKAIIEKYKPDEIAIEELFFNNNAKTAITVGQARGVLVVAAANRNIPIYEYTPLQIKQALTGYGRADKKQMQNMVKMMLGLNAIPKPDDAADALAAAICHAHSYRMNNITGMS